MPGRATNDPTDYVAVGLQSAKDAEATAFYFLKHLDGSGFDVEPEVTAEREGGDGQEIGYSYVTLVKADGALNAAARPEWTGRALGAVLGADTASQVSGVLTDHTLIPAATTPYLTVEQQWSGERERNTNVKLSQVDIEFEAGKPLKISAQTMSGGTVYRQTAAALTPVRESVRPIFYPGASLVLTGAAGAKVTKGKISIVRGLDDSIQTTSLNREDLVETTQDYNVDLTLKFEDATIYRAAKYNGGTTILQTLPTMGLDLFAAQSSYSARFVHPLLEVTGAKTNKLDPDGKTVFLDLALRTVKGATVPFFARVRNAATAPHA